MNLTLKIGEEYLLLILDWINDFFLHNLIRNNVAFKTGYKNIILQNFESTNNNDVLKESKIIFLWKVKPI